MSLTQHLIDHAALGIAPADPVGTAASLVAGHEASVNPHPSYLTEVEADAKYALIGEGGGGGAAIIRTPEPISPLTNTTEFAVDGTLQASAYAPLYSADSRDYREFNIDVIAGDFSSPVASIQVDSDSWSISPNIVDNTDYKWRCRDKSLNGDYSAWSDAQSFKTFDIYVVTPTITDPTEGGEFVEKGQEFTGSAFQIVNTSDTHAASYWVIKDTSGIVVYQTGRDTVNLTSFQPPPGVIVPGQVMSVELIYESSFGYVSEVATRGFVGVYAPYEKYLVSVGGTSTGGNVSLYGQDVDTFNELTPPDYPSANTNFVSFDPTGQYLIVQNRFYKRDGDTFNFMYSSPTGFPANPRGSVFSPNGNYFAEIGSTAPYLRVLKKTSTDTFTPLTPLARVMSSIHRAGCFSPSGDVLCAGVDASPYLAIYDVSADSFTRNLNIDTAPSGAVCGCAFTSDGEILVLSVNYSAERLALYRRTGGSYTKIQSPATIPTGVYLSGGKTVAVWSNYVFISGGSTGCWVYKVVNLSLEHLTTIPESSNGIAVSPDGFYVAITSGSSTAIYKRNGDIFTKILPVLSSSATRVMCDFYPAV